MLQLSKLLYRAVRSNFFPRQSTHTTTCPATEQRAEQREALPRLSFNAGKIFPAGGKLLLTRSEHVCKGSPAKRPTEGSLAKERNAVYTANGSCGSFTGYLLTFIGNTN